MPTPTGYTIASAQYSARRGDIHANLDKHVRMTEAAAREGVDFLVFPELSVTGYEMDLAEELQTTPDGSLFMPLHLLAAQHDMRVMVGMPLRAPSGKPYLGSLILGGAAPVAYHKVHVHKSEEPYFQPDDKVGMAEHKGAKLGLAICADLNHPSHAARAADCGADIYAASALISVEGYDREAKMLEGYARAHDMAVMLANYATQSGDYIPPGGSAIWAPGGRQVAIMNDTEVALVMATKTAENGWVGKVKVL
ncbi:carbon-nitrogen hydrolase family protein [Kordiimonas aestuarii]|uniref:carbon-nitrogen hydrolase family protein n=1 Tax=Kordiimonas aestuarii TaxID=1005925 RepID=UPI0021D189B1|nr:carbon-nitrogen hydrolase family protein [Kordiimonas aestuarii]